MPSPRSGDTPCHSGLVWTHEVWTHELTAEHGPRRAVKSRLSLAAASSPCGHAGADSGGSSSRAGDSTLDSAVRCPAWPHLQNKAVRVTLFRTIKRGLN